MKKTIIMSAVGVVVLGGAFYGGMHYANGKTANARAQFSGTFARNGTGGTGGGIRGAGANGGFTAGDIIAKDDKSITIKLRDGGSKIIFFSSSTGIEKFGAGTSADLQIGKSVSITGMANSDGSVTAQSIQLRPLMPSSSPQPSK